LDKIIADWTRGQNRHEVEALLQRVGVPAGAVNRIKDLYLDPHFGERGFFQWYERPDAKEMGDVRSRPYPGWPFKMSKTQPTIESIPNFAEHNGYVLGEILGMTETEITELRVDGVTGSAPVEADKLRPKPSKPGSEVGRGGVHEVDPDYKSVLGLQY